MKVGSQVRLANPLRKEKHGTMAILHFEKIIFPFQYDYLYTQIVSIC